MKGGGGFEAKKALEEPSLFRTFLLSTGRAEEPRKRARVLSAGIIEEREGKTKVG